MLKVRIAEVNRSLLKSMGVNLLSKDTTGGFQFGIGRGNPGTIPATGSPTFNISQTGTTLAGFGKFLGLDLLGSLDLAANDGVATILAEPNLTALSGETASFLAGGEFPIPVSQGGTGSGPRSRLNINNMVSALLLRRSCWPAAAFRCASVRKLANSMTQTASR